MLIELLIAIVISTIMTSVLVEIYITMHRQYQLQIALNEIQNTAKKVMSIISRSIKVTGNIGCPRLSADFPIISHTSFSITTKNKLIGDPSQMIVMHAAYSDAKLIKLLNSTTILVRTYANIKLDDVLVISDCKHAEMVSVVHMVTSGQEKKLTLNHVLQYQYESGITEVNILEISRFYVAKTTRMTASGNSIYAFYYMDINGIKNEIAEGVRGIHFHYDISDPPFHVDHVTDAANVIGVSIQLDLEIPPLKKSWYSYVSLRDS